MCLPMVIRLCCFIFVRGRFRQTESHGYIADRAIGLLSALRNVAREKVWHFVCVAFHRPVAFYAMNLLVTSKFHYRIGTWPHAIVAPISSSTGVRTRTEAHLSKFMETTGRSSQCINLLSAPLQARCGPELQPRKLVHALNAEPALKVKVGVKGDRKWDACESTCSFLPFPAPSLLKCVSAMPCPAVAGVGALTLENLTPMRMPTTSVSCNCGCKQPPCGCQFEPSPGGFPDYQCMPSEQCTFPI